MKPKKKKQSVIRRLSQTPTVQIYQKKIGELLSVYEDLESTLRNLRRTYSSGAQLANSINVKKLIEQLSRSKRQLERKIGNTLLLEKQSLKRKLTELRDSF